MAFFCNNFQPFLFEKLSGLLPVIMKLPDFFVWIINFSAKLEKRDKAGEIKTLIMSHMISLNELRLNMATWLKKRKVIHVIIFHFFSEFMDFSSHH